MESMEDEWIKSNTDCVYFLASPLTCKKGIECEYRHSEIARLNPRDCRYWFTGLCLNPNCAFRHPPLDGPEDKTLESANVYDQSAATLKKTNVPCHFFFNGFCNKGQRCLFLHGPSDNANGEPVKVVSAVVERPAMEKKIVVGNSAASGAPLRRHAIPIENVPQSGAGTVRKPEVEIHRSNIGNALKQAAFQQSSEPLFAEHKTCTVNSPPLGRESMHGVYYVSPDESSVDRVESHTEKEDCLESSPGGFDVLVGDNTSEKLEYKVDPNVLLCENEERNRLNVQHMGYRYGGVDFDLRPPHERALHEHEDYQSHDDSDIENLHINAITNHVRERSFELGLSRKRTLMRARPASGFGDLRDLLKKRRLTNGHYQDCFSRTFRSSESEETYPYPGLTSLQGRLSTNVVGNAVGSRIENGSFLKNTSQKSRLMNSRLSRSRQPLNEKRRGRQQFRNDNAASRKRQSSEELMIFTGPRSTFKVRAEKRKPKEIIDSRERTEPANGATVEDFQGPKPLSDILKGKRMLKSVVSCVNQ